MRPVSSPPNVQVKHFTLGEGESEGDSQGSGNECFSHEPLLDGLLVPILFKNF